MKNSHEMQLAKMIVKEWTRRYGGWWKASLLMSETIAEALVAKDVMSIIMTQEDGIKDDDRDLSARSLYATIYREACKILFPWWREESTG